MKGIICLRGVKRFALRRIKSLYIPYVTINIAFLLLHNFLLKINLYTDNGALFVDPCISDTFGAIPYYTSKDIMSYGIKVLLLAYGEKISTTWFLGARLITSVFWILTNYIFNKAFGQNSSYASIIFGLILLCGCWSFDSAGISIPLAFYVKKLCYTYFLLDIGQIAKKLVKLMNKSLLISVCLPALVGVVYAERYEISFAANRIVNPSVCLLVSIAGFVTVLGIASIVPNNKYMRWFSYIGQHTMCIMLWHFLAFKVVNLVQIFYYKLPMYYLASTPTLYVSSIYWKLLYLFMGVVLPIMVAIVWGRIKQYMSVKSNKFIDHKLCKY